MKDKFKNGIKGLFSINSEREEHRIGDVTEIPFISTGKEFPPVSHQARINTYKRNKELFMGNHFDVFKNFKGSQAQKDLLYVSVNLAGIVCKKSADFLFGEAAQYSAAKEENSNEQIAINRLVEENDLGILTYEMALSNAYRGDSFIKVRYGQELGGELPESIDVPRTIIETVNPEFVFPETSLYSRNKISAYHIAVPVKVNVDGKTVWQLFIERHYAGRIEYRVYNMVEKDISYHKGYKEVDTWKIGNEILSERKIVPTGVAYPLVVHIPNFATDDSWEGIDDLTEHIPVLEEINNRLTQIAEVLNAHANPAMAVPSGILGEDENGQTYFNVARDKVFEVMGKDDVIPEYITWEGQLTSAFQELDLLVELFLTTSEVPSVALGKSDSGTSGSSGLAIKWRMNSLLAKINRKRQYFDKGLKMALYLAQELEHAVSKTDYEVVVPKIKFNDGLPQDETELATIMNIRTGGMQTLSQKSAIMRLENMTEEQAEIEIERIKAEQEAEREVEIDIEKMFNQDSNVGLEDVDNNDTSKHAEGNPVTDKATVGE